MGYNLDDEPCFFNDGVQDEPPYNSEAKDEDCPTSMLHAAELGDLEEEEATEADTHASKPWFLSQEQIRKMNVDMLNDALKKRGLKPRGKKADLVLMITDALEQRLPLQEDSDEPVDQLTGFPVGAKCRLLKPSTVPVVMPLNPLRMFV